MTVTSCCCAVVDEMTDETMRHNLAGEHVDIKVRRSYDYETMTI